VDNRKDAKANEVQIAGTHYRNEYQHWDYVADNGLGYFDGQVTKYVTRWRRKNGVQDLEKAKHFTLKLIELIEAKILAIVETPAQTPVGFFDYVIANNLSTEEAHVIYLMTTFRSVKNLRQALKIIQRLIDEQNNQPQQKGGQ
jgi:hypothetical protein